jgi:hypothetical protein
VFLFMSTLPCVATPHVGPDAPVWAAEQSSANLEHAALRRHSPRSPRRPRLGSRAKLGHLEHAAMRRHSPRRPRRPRLGSRAKLGNLEHAAVRRHSPRRPRRPRLGSRAKLGNFEQRSCKSENSAGHASAPALGKHPTRWPYPSAATRLPVSANRVPAVPGR